MLTLFPLQPSIVFSAASNYEGKHCLTALPTPQFSLVDAPNLTKVGVICSFSSSYIFLSVILFCVVLIWYCRPLHYYTVWVGGIHDIALFSKTGGGT